MNKGKRYVALILTFCLVLSMTVIVRAVDEPLAFSSASGLPGGKIGEPYSYRLSAQGGTPGYKFSLVSGFLPSGLRLSSKGVISGTPTGYGYYPSITIAVSDATGARVTKRFSINITAMAVDFVVTDYDVPYDGQPHGVTVTPMIDGADASDEVTYSVWYSNSQQLPTDAGAYQISIYPGPGFRMASQSQRVMYIRSDDSSSIELTDLNVQYDGLPQMPTVHISPADLTYRLDYYDEEGTALSAPPTEPGTYTVRYTTTNSNYTVRSGSVQFVIDRIPVTFSAEDHTAVYDDGKTVPYPKDLVHEELGASSILGLPQYSVCFDDLSTEEVERLETVTNAGNYQVYAVFSEEDAAHYTVPTQPLANFTVEKKPVDFVVSNNVAIANGSAHYATVTATNAPNLDPSHVTVSFRQNGEDVEAPTEAGIYDIYIHVEDENYTFDGYHARKLTISEPSMVPVQIEGWRTTYNGQPQRATASLPEGVTAEGTLHVQYRVGDKLVDEVTEAGEYPIEVTWEGSEEVEIGSISHEKFVILPEAVAFSLAQDHSEYDGTAVDIQVITNPEVPLGSFEYDTVYTKDGAVASSIMEAGSYQVEIRNVDSNHAVSGSNLLSYTVEKKPVDFSVTDKEKIVTGSGLAPTITVVESTLIDGESLSEGTDYTVSYYSGRDLVEGLPTEVGTYRIHVEVKHPNYTFNDFLPETFTILPKTPVNFTVTNTLLTYTGEQQKVAVTPQEGYDGDFTVQYRDKDGVLTNSVQDAGTYDIVVTLGESTEYELGTLDHSTLTVRPATIVFTLEQHSGEYSGQRHDPVVHTSPELTAEDYSISYQKNGIPVTELVDAGTYTVNIALNDSNYASNVPSLTYTVTKRPVRFLVSDNRRLYSGQRMGATITVDPESLVNVGDVTMDQCTVSYYNGGINLGVLPRELGEYQIYVDVTNDNYAFNGFLTDTFVITAPTPVQFTVTDTEKVYTGRGQIANVQPPEEYTGDFIVQYRDASGTLLNAPVNAGIYTIVVTPADETIAAVLDQSTFTIAPEPVHVSLKSGMETLYYQGVVDAVELLTSDSATVFPPEFAVTLEKDGAPVDEMSDVGTYALTVSITDGNHTLTEPTVLEVEILPVTVRFSLAQMETAYTGNPIVPQFVTDPEGAQEFFSVTYRQGEETFETITDSGEYLLQISPLGENYILASDQAELRFTISKGEPLSVHLSYGNMPFGMIAKSVASTSERETLQTQFRENRIYDGILYMPDAWTETIWDENEFAVVVREIRDFAEPGFVFYDEQGEPVASDAVNRSIQGSYVCSSMDEEATTVNMSLGENTLLELNQNGIQLGLFTITYTYGEQTASRTLIVLPRTGDATLDGSVNGADADYIAGGTGLAGTVEEALRTLYLYRVCDVDKSGQVDNGDVSAIENRRITPIQNYYI